MQKFTLKDVVYTWIRPELAKQVPTGVHIHGPDVIIERGLVVEFEGSRGIVFDILNLTDPFSFEVEMYWFEGPLANEEKERKKFYSSTEFVAFLHLELEEETI